MPELTLRDIRDLAEKKVPPDEHWVGPSQYIYIQLGKRLGIRTRLRTEARTSVDDDDVMLDLDEEGRIYGIEIGIAAKNL